MVTSRCAECGARLPTKPASEAQHCPACGHHFGPDPCGFAYDCPKQQRSHTRYHNRMRTTYHDRGA